MALSSGGRNLAGMIGGWCLALVFSAGLVVYFDEWRELLGIKLSPADFGLEGGAEAGGGDGRFMTVAASSAEPESVRRFGVVELTADQRGHFETEVRLNGRGANVLVDTGATLVALTYEDAVAAGLSVGAADFRYYAQTANGRARFAKVRIDEVRLGDIVVRDVDASVAEPGRLHVTLLGMSFLGKLRLNMQPGRLVLEQ